MNTGRTAINLAWNRFSSLNPELVARAGKVKYREDKFEVPFLADTYIIDRENQKVLRDKAEAGDYFSILILHYLIGVKDIPLSGKILSFKNLPSGRFYFSAFRQRSLQPLIETFGKRPGSLLAAGEALGAEKFAQGDAGITVKVFPMLPCRFHWSSGKGMRNCLPRQPSSLMPQLRRYWRQKTSRLPQECLSGAWSRKAKGTYEDRLLSKFSSCNFRVNLTRKFVASLLISF
ncbi:MAG: DUF3786 domain-containing protein [Nitrospirae bacterium]|nr:DUF3786 domain-containing protein [Nitrospirota bacterium]